MSCLKKEKRKQEGNKKPRRGEQQPTTATCRLRGDSSVRTPLPRPLRDALGLEDVHLNRMNCVPTALLRPLSYEAQESVVAGPRKAHRRGTRF